MIPLTGNDLKIILFLLMSLLPLTLAGLGTYLAWRASETSPDTRIDMASGAILCWLGALVGGLGICAFVWKLPP